MYLLGKHKWGRVNQHILCVIIFIQINRWFWYKFFTITSKVGRFQHKYIMNSSNLHWTCYSIRGYYLHFYTRIIRYFSSFSVYWFILDYGYLPTLRTYVPISHWNWKHARNWILVVIKFGDTSPVGGIPCRCEHIW